MEMFQQSQLHQHVGLYQWAAFVVHVEEIFTESSVTGTVGIICFQTKAIFIWELAGCRLLLQLGPALSKNDFFEVSRL